MSIRKGTTIIAGNSSPLDWTGTLQEYNIALENGTIKENMVCYITDDTLYTDDIRPEIETLNSVKANKDLSNLSEVGEKHFLNKSQITNCITEIPQRIKYTLEDGTLTIKAGSVVIIPYGTEDLTAQYPVGATFLNNNFKVYDTQYIDGKFFVWTEVQTDIIRTNLTPNDSYTKYVQLTLTDSKGLGMYLPVIENSRSGSSDEAIQYGTFYNTSTNYCKNADNIGDVCSLPFLSVYPSNGYFFVDEVFNGMGVIGRTVWLEKGVKALLVNAKNEDGTWNNIEFTSDRIYMRTLATPSYNSSVKESVIFVPFNSEIPYFRGCWNYDYEEVDDGIHVKSTDETLKGVVIGTWNAQNGYMNNFQLREPFRAISYSDRSKVTGWSFPSSKYVDLELGASGSTYTAPANGWFWLVKATNKVDQHASLMNVTKAYIKDERQSPYSGGLLTPKMSAQKGDTVTLTYNAGGTTYNWMFIYAEGDV